MCCCSRYTFAIILGSISLVLSVLLFIGQCGDFKRSSSAIFNLIKFAIEALISGIFIFAIVKRKYKLMLPWLSLCVFGMIESLITIIGGVIDALNINTTGDKYIVDIVIGVLGLGIGIALFWFSLSLYKQIRSETVRKPGSAAVGY